MWPFASITRCSQSSRLVPRPPGRLAERGFSLSIEQPCAARDQHRDVMQLHDLPTRRSETWYLVQISASVRNGPASPTTPAIRFRPPDRTVPGSQTAGQRGRPGRVGRSRSGRVRFGSDERAAGCERERFPRTRPSKRRRAVRPSRGASREVESHARYRRPPPSVISRARAAITASVSVDAAPPSNSASMASRSQRGFRGPSSRDGSGIQPAFTKRATASGRTLM